MKHPIFGFLFSLAIFWGISVYLLDSIGVSSWTLNIIILILLMPVALECVNELEGNNKDKKP
jgi:hypothetical protein